MKIRFAGKLTIFVLLLLSAATVAGIRSEQSVGPIRFSMTVDPSVQAEPVSGRILLLVSHTEKFAPGINGTPVFGANVVDWKPGERAYVDESAMGHPVRSIRDLPEGEYFVQGWLNVYTACGIATRVAARRTNRRNRGGVGA